MVWFLSLQHYWEMSKTPTNKLLSLIVCSCLFLRRMFSVPKYEMNICDKKYWILDTPRNTICGSILVTEYMTQYWLYKMVLNICYTICGSILDTHNGAQYWFHNMGLNIGYTIGGSIFAKQYRTLYQLCNFGLNIGVI